MDHTDHININRLFSNGKVKTCTNSLLFDKKTIFDVSGLTSQKPKIDSLQVECVKALTPFILLFRTIGLLPVKILNGRSDVIYVNFSIFRMVTWLGAFLQAYLIIRSLRDAISVAAVAENADSVTIVEYANTIIYYSHVFTVNVIMSVKVKRFPDFITACKKVEGMCQKYTFKSYPKDSMVFKSWAIFGIIFSAQVAGEMVYYTKVAYSGNTTATFSTFLTRLDSTSLFPNVERSRIAGILQVIVDYYCDVGWTFGEHLISILAFIITCYFSRLNYGIANSTLETVADIEGLRRDHRNLKDLVELYNSIFSPILLVTYVGNLGYLLGRLYVSVAKDLSSTPVVLAENLYAFSFLAGKIFLTSWFAANMHEKAHESLDTIHDWSSSIETEDCKYRIMVINRFVSQLVTDPVHFNGCGYFTLTKAFIVTLISGIIGYEVIILQFQQAAGVVK